MKFLYKISLFIISLFSLLNAQYTIQSPYLKNPDLSIGYVDSCATFWLQTWDSDKGGFFTNINKYGNLIVGVPANKHMLTQSRNAYGLARAFMLTGDTTYLNYARNALDFMYQSAWDQTYGGWFQDVDVNGNPIYPLADKQTFYQLYALLGLFSYYEATDDTLIVKWFWGGYDHNENILWDSRPGYEGYYNVTNYNGVDPRHKSFNATVDAITTYMLYMNLMFDDDSSRERLQQLAEQIKIHLVASMDDQAMGFVEKYDSDWNWNNSETMTIMGHVLKTAWCLGRIYQNDPDTSYINAAEKLALHVWNNGYDHDYGGPYKDYDRVTGQMLLWGNPDTTKASWQMEQAITAGLMLYDITGDPLYLQMADESLDFFMKYFVDHDYGEIYADRTRYGGYAWNENKGSDWKAGYHSIELGYYVYLYGNLFVHEVPVTLHYKFDSTDQDRIFRMTPLAIANNKLCIQMVTKDGQAYSNFNSQNRELTLPANVGGHFVVTYELIPVIITSGSEVLPTKFVLFQNYPNPFNPTTAITYQLSMVSQVDLSIYNVMGQKVAELVSEKQPAGSYNVEWDAKEFASGVYFYRLTTDRGFIQTRKLVVLK